MPDNNLEKIEQPVLQQAYDHLVDVRNYWLQIGIINDKITLDDIASIIILSMPLPDNISQG